MLTPDDARTRVHRGAAHLDTVHPGWARAIDPDVLNLGSCWRCILGQLYKDFDLGVRVLGMPSIDGWWDEGDPAVRLGFVLANVDNDPNDASVYDELRADYDVLRDAWLTAIADRQLAVVLEKASV